jgi:ribosomal protein S18 acetylase RimI-like enzyme
MKNSNETVLIRQAQENDIAQLLVLLQQLFSIEADFEFDANKQSEGLRQLINNSKTDETRAAVFVLTIKDKIIAMCSCQIIISTAEGGKSGLVEDVVVDQDYRGQRIGRQLMQHLLTWAEAQGVRRLQLLADNNNATSLSFYQQQSWQRTRLSAWFKML